MGTEDSELTLQGLAQRLEALERVNERMRSENAKLRDEVTALRGSDARRSEVATMEGSGRPPTEDGEPPASEWFGSDGQVSRKWLLSKAGAAAVGTLAAGALLLRDTREAKATHITDEWFTADTLFAHELIAIEDGGEIAVYGETTSDDASGVYGYNNGSGPGVKGFNEGTGPAVEGRANGSGGTGVKGTGRYGVWGESNQAGFYGVVGRNTNTDGTGVWGRGAKRGVLGESTNGIGVEGSGKNGVYGESSTEGQNGVWGRHTNKGAGVSGEGRVGVIGFSHEDGWPGMWGRHTANGAGVSGDSAKGVGVYGEASAEGNQGVFGRAKGASQGVAGEGLNGTGVLGNGKTGVVGASTGAGYGGQFQGGKAQLRLVPKGSAGAPTTGRHSQGEIYMDSSGTLFVCTAGDGTTVGTWKKVNTTAV